MCSDNHDEIIFEGGHYVKCPLCEALDKIEGLEKDIEELQNIPEPPKNAFGY